MPEKVRELTAAIPGWTVDYEADAAYMQLTKTPVARTVTYGAVNVDLDAEGRAVGVEILTLNWPEPPQPEQEPA